MLYFSTPDGTDLYATFFTYWLGEESIRERKRYTLPHEPNDLQLGILEDSVHAGDMTLDDCDFTEVYTQGDWSFQVCVAKLHIWDSVAFDVAAAPITGVIGFAGIFLT